MASDDGEKDNVVELRMFQGGKGKQTPPGMPPRQVAVNRSAVRLFGATMEDAAQGLIHSACVVGRSMDGKITIRWTQPIDEIQMIGLLEAAKAMLLQNLRSTSVPTPLGEDDPGPGTSG